MFCTRCGNSAKDHEKRFCTRCGLKYRQIHTSATQVATTKEVAPERKTSISGRNREFLESLVGRTIDQRYTLESPIGFGAMGAVYRAKRINIGDTAAIKILKPEHTADPRTVERFQREAQVGARLRHPNIVSVYDFGVSEENLVYFAMEMIDGENLRTMLVQNGPISQSVAVEIIGQVCSALEEAHRHEIVHRDLKPENIIVRKQTTGLDVKVLDFGIASFRNLNFNKLTGSEGLMGTPHYMSPEQWLGEKVDRRSDIYSLGLILFEMLSGRPPLPAMISTQQAEGVLPGLRALNPNVSPEIEAVVMHALEKDPAARPQSAEELARELQSALRGYHPRMFVQQTIAEHPSGSKRTRRATPPQKGRSFLQMAILLIFLGASATAGGLWWAKKYAPASAHTMTDAESLNNQMVVPSPSLNVAAPEPTPTPSPEPIASPEPDVAPLAAPTVKPTPTRRIVAPVKKKQERKPETIKKPAPKNVLSKNESDDRDRFRFRDSDFGGGRFGYRTHGYGDGMGWLRERWARERAFRWGYRRGYRNAAESDSSDSKDKDDDKDRARRRRDREER